MTFERVGIVGSGIMGAGIAEVAAAHGHCVVVASRSEPSAKTLLSTVEASLDRQVAKSSRTPEEREEILHRVTTTTDLDGVSECDVVIEAIVEDLGAKLAVFGSLGRACGSRTVLATTTSTLPVVELAMESGAPERVCGIHFFNPAPVMPLVEIVRTIVTSEETVTAAHAFAVECGKEPVDVQDRAGFVVNALLFGYLNSAVRLFEQNVATMEGIDTAMRGGAGHPMGPFALLDLVGLDTAVAILDALHREHREPQYSAAPSLRRRVSAGLLGRKTGRGFYDYPRS